MHSYKRYKLCRYIFCSYANIWLQFYDESNIKKDALHSKLFLTERDFKTQRLLDDVSYLFSKCVVELQQKKSLPSGLFVRLNISCSASPDFPVAGSLSYSSSLVDLQNEKVVRALLLPSLSSRHRCS
jgi:hypothetical protein